MPQMANIVVKKADGTTDFTFTQLSASPGDGGMAQWRGAGASSPALAANLRCSSKWNKARTVRQIEITGDLPVVHTNSGIDAIVARPSFRLSYQVPLNTPDVAGSDFAAVMNNAIASVLIKSVVASGFAPT